LHLFHLIASNQSTQLPHPQPLSSLDAKNAPFPRQAPPQPPILRLHAALAFATRDAIESAVRVLIIPDKFKGTLTARQAGEAIAAGWSEARPDDQLELLPMSDGGDGFGEVIGAMMGATEVKVATVDSAHRPHNASLWWQAETQTAVIEAAQVNGLAQLPPGQFHPFNLDTFGLAEVYRKAAELGAERITVGIGGSATNDAGFGFARGLGWKFLDAEGREIERWTDLESLSRLEPPSKGIFVETIVAVDVQNPLLGPNGASRIYGPQKGLREQDMEKAEACLQRLAHSVQKLNQQALPAFSIPKLDADAIQQCGNYYDVPGAGAAGGLGFGLMAFLGAKFISGAELFADAAHLDDRLKTADILISGEGSIDEQSLMGKGVGWLFDRAKAAGVKRIGLAGSLGPGLEEAFKFDDDLRLLGIVPGLTTLERAKAEPARWLRDLAAKAAKNTATY